LLRHHHIAVKAARNITSPDEMPLLIDAARDAKTANMREC